MTALALRDDQDYWDATQLAVLESSGIDRDVTKAELTAFLHECLRRKLDPFTRQIYLIGRFDKRQQRKVYRSQTSIDGFRLIARRAADKSGIDYSYEDTIWFDRSGGRHEIWLSAEPPAGAKVVVVRNGSRFDAVARFGAYVQTDRNGNPLGQWVSMPDVMIAKCAEALALRKAFPEDLGGLYTEEEMAQADNPQRAHAVAEVIRDDASAGAHGKDTVPGDAAWQVRTEEGASWLAAAIGTAPELATLDMCRELWRAASQRARAGDITSEDARQVQDILKARMEELKSAPASAGEAGDRPASLDPADPWAAKVEALATEDDAEEALSELLDLATSGGIDDSRFAQVEAAVLAKFPALRGEGEAAA